MLTEPLKGVIVPVPTTIDSEGRFDTVSMEIMIDRVLESDVDALLFLGSTGEFSHFSIPVRKAVTEFCIQYVGGRKPVIIGTSSCGTDAVINMSQHATYMGADAVMVVNPFYLRLTPERIFQHYCAIARHIQLPIYLYNFPALTGQELSVDLVLRLALECPNIVGIKDTVDGMSHTRELITKVKGARPDFQVFCGFDEYALNTLMIGGDGVIPATANFAPEVCCGLYKAFKAGDFEGMQKAQRQIAILSELYTLDTPFAGLVKEAVRMTGSDISVCVASPCTVPDEPTKARLVQLLAQAGVQTKDIVSQSKLEYA